MRKQSTFVIESSRFESLFTSEIKGIQGVQIEISRKKDPFPTASLRLKKELQTVVKNPISHRASTKRACRRRAARSVFGVLLMAASILATGVQADQPTSKKASAFPIQDPYLATVIGTPPALQTHLDPPLKLKIGRWVRFPKRDVPPVFWNGKTLRYAWAAQTKAAPLVFVLAGTGGSFFDSKVRFLMGALHQAGFHVVGLSSPTHTSFITAGSQYEMPGRPAADAEDLMAVMEQIRDQLADRIEIQGFGVVGYSLGGTDAAFIADLDTRQKKFDFFEVYLINPAVNLHTSAEILDRLYDQALPEGEESINQLVSNSLKKAIHYVHSTGSTPLGSDFIFQAVTALQPTDQDLEGVIATSFRLSSANMSFTADAMTHSGRIVKPDQTLRIGTEMEGYFDESLQWSFVRYLEELLLPFWEEQTQLDRDTLIAQSSLASIQDFLKEARHVDVVTNRDDIILGPGDLEFLSQTFGPRATIHPHGGHCGNLEFAPNVETMQKRFVSAAQARGWTP